MNALLLEFRAWGRNEKGWSENTVEQYARIVGAFAHRLEERGTNLVDCDATALRETLWSFPPKPSTRNAYCAALDALYGFLTATQRRADNPAKALSRVRQRRGLPRPLESDDLRLYMKAARGMGPRYYALAALGAGAGLRLTEAATLAWEAVGREQLRIRGKGEKERDVPITPWVAEALAEWRSACPSPTWVFPSMWGPRKRTGRPISRKYASDLHYRVADAAGLPRLAYGFHRLRHTFATEALEGSRDLRAVQELLGHSSPATTAVYTLVRPERLRNVVAGMYERREW
jgi:site-specific recombinase XerD